MWQVDEEAKVTPQLAKTTRYRVIRECATCSWRDQPGQHIHACGGCGALMVAEVINGKG